MYKNTEIKILYEKEDKNIYILLNIMNNITSVRYLT